MQAYAGVGYLVLRDRSFLPDEIVFTVNYLGSPQISFTLNFSKSAVQVIGSYYQMLRLGKSGYRAIMGTLTETADYLSEYVDKYQDGKLFQLISETEGRGLPLVAWQLKEGAAHWDEFALARALRAKGWIVPAYTMAPR
jgi:glutamate decarboxylase